MFTHTNTYAYAHTHTFVERDHENHRADDLWPGAYLFIRLDLPGAPGAAGP